MIYCKSYKLYVELRKSGFENDFLRQVIFFKILISKIGVKRDLRIFTKNNAADPEIGFLTKSI